MQQFIFNEISYDLSRLVAAGKECPVSQIVIDRLEITDETLVSDKVSEAMVVARGDKYLVIVKGQDPLEEMNKCHILSKYALKKAKSDNVYENSMPFNTGRGIGQQRSTGVAGRNQQRGNNERYGRSY